MSCNVKNIILIIIASLLSAVSPILIKKYIKYKKTYLWLLIISLICSAIIVIIYIKLLKTYGAGKMYTIIKILSVLIVAMIGFLFLDEKFTTKNIIGIIFGGIALILLF